MKQYIGILIILGSTLCYAVIPALFKKAGLKLQPFTIIAISMFFLFTASVIFSLVFEKSSSFKLANYKNEVLILGLTGLINVLGFWLAINAYKYMPLWQQSMFTLLVPPIAGISAYFILGEALSARLLVGLIIMGIGLFIALAK